MRHESHGQEHLLVSQQHYCYTEWVAKGEIGYELRDYYRAGGAYPTTNQR